ncbi:unnamed protein product [Caenorhabditis auriculariae]|uniref:Uncharacterized protein n=1 Tax=Caenorhabditis auriculariae TaxID=2777116 RepID=A0A8S1GTQ8_9PELO|nr:unnamed protein product [Caenorhabditis auriculariae]
MVLATTSTPLRPLPPKISDYILQCEAFPARNNYNKSNGFSTPLERAGSQNSDPESSQPSDRYVKLNIFYLVSMTFASICFAFLAILFAYRPDPIHRQGKLGTTSYNNYVNILRDILHCLDISIVIFSTATFFTNLLQLLFILKFAKRSPPSLCRKYIRKTSFLRVVTYSFWFFSVIAFMAAVLITCMIDNTRSLASRCVGVTLGVSAIFLCFAAMVELGGNTPFRQSFDNYVFIIPAVAVVILVAYVVLKLKETTQSKEKNGRK